MPEHGNITGLFIPRVILQDPILSMGEKLVLSEVHYLDNENGCWASNAHIGRLVGLSARQVSTYISRLRVKGHIRWEVSESNRTGRSLRSNVVVPEQARNVMGELRRQHLDVVNELMAERRANARGGTAVSANGMPQNHAEHDFF